jgi:hypothetical protein
MALRTDFTDFEWTVLENTPVWAFIMTSAADGKVDKKELQAFAKELSETMQYQDELAREVFLSLISHLNTVFPSCMQNPGMVIEGLQSAGRIVDSKCPQHAEGFKGSVLLICKNVAEASGGGLFKRNKISDKEAAAVMLVAGALGARL